MPRGNLFYLRKCVKNKARVGMLLLWPDDVPDTEVRTAA